MKKTFLFIIIILLIIISGCNKVQPTSQSFNYEEAYESYVEKYVELNDIDKVEISPDLRQTVLYYKDVNGFIVPVMRQIPRKEGIAKECILALIDTPENRLDLLDLGLQPVLPVGTEIELAIKEDGLIKINFNDKILSIPSKKEEAAMVQAIVYTLTEFQTVDKVQIMVNNQIYETLTNGTVIKEPINRGNINPVNNFIDGEFIKMTFYMYNNISNKYTYYIPITKNIPKSSNQTINIVNEELNLMTFVNNALLEVPTGFKINNIVIEEKIAYLSLQTEIDTSDIKVKTFMKALSLTLKENENIDSIKIILENNNVEDMKVITYSIPIFANVY